MSAPRKTAARMAAAQMLYQQRVNPEPKDTDTLIREFSEREDGKKTDGPLLRKILESFYEKKDAIDQLLAGLSTDQWKADRMSPLILAILESAASEMLAKNPQPHGVLVSEYVGIAGRFFDEEETGFVNAALDKLGKRIAS